MGDLALFVSGDNKKAVRYYSNLIWWKPSASGIYFNRGDAYSNDGQYENAISDYEKSLQLGISDSLQAILRIALNERKMGNIKNEEQRLIQLLKLSINKHQNEFWAANYHLGQVEFRKGNYRKAIGYYNVAHKIKPTKLEIYHRANAYFALGLHDSARQDFNESLQFVKMDFVKMYPNSEIAQCDTCGFQFGSKEYELLTEPDSESMINKLKKYLSNEEITKLKDSIKSKNNR